MIKGNELSANEKKLMEGAVFLPPGKAFGWYYLLISGEPYQRGFQHGYYLGDIIWKTIRDNFFGNWIESGKDLEFFAQAAERLWLDKIDDEFLAELQGIVDGTNRRGSTAEKPFSITLAELLAWNGYNEITGYWWPLEFAATNSNFIPRNRERCSGFIATGEATKNGRTVMAHETWEKYIQYDCNRLLLEIQPAKGHHLIMQSMVGHIDSGSDFIITDAGLMVTETTMGGGFTGYDANGTPEFYRFRKASQYAESMEQWIRFMLINNSAGVANSWLLGNTHNNEIMRFELGLKYHNIERKTNGAFYGNNVASDPRIRCLETSDPALWFDIRDSGARRARWIQLIGDLDEPEGVPVNKKEKEMGQYYGKVDVDNAVVMLGDHFDVYEYQKSLKGDKEIKKKNFENPCGHTLCSHLDLDAANPKNHADQPPFYPWGSLDGKVTDSQMAKKMSFVARSGHPCGMEFDADEFLRQHPQYRWLNGRLTSMKKNPWVLCEKEKLPVKYSKK